MKKRFLEKAIFVCLLFNAYTSSAVWAQELPTIGGDFMGSYQETVHSGGIIADAENVRAVIEINVGGEGNDFCIEQAQGGVNISLPAEQDVDFKAAIRADGDIKINTAADAAHSGSRNGVLLDWYNDNGYGNDTQALKADFSAGGNFIIGSYGAENTAKSGIHVDTYAGTVNVKAGQDVIIDVEGEQVINATEGGHIAVDAGGNIILQADSQNNDIVMGYISSMNNSFVKANDKLVGVNGIREAEVSLKAQGDITLSARESSQNNLMNVGIFAVGTRKDISAISGGDERNEQFIDSEGYVKSEKNTISLTGNSINIDMQNEHGIANGILVQDSDLASVILNSETGVKLVAAAKEQDSVALDVADGNIKISAASGSNIIQAITENKNSQGIAIQTEEKDYLAKNRIDINAFYNNTVYGTTTAIAATGSDSVINVAAQTGDNIFMTAAATDIIEAANGSQVNVAAENGVNYFAHEDDSTGSKAVNASGGANVNISGAENNFAGMIFAKNAATQVNLQGNNTVFSSAYGISDAMKNTATAVYADDNASISFTAGTGEINRIGSDVAFASDEKREITVWAQQGGQINIDGAAIISASNYGEYTDGKKGNALGIAVSAGGRQLEREDGILKPVKNISRVTIDYASDISSSIAGDILAGYGGEVLIGQDLTGTSRTETAAKARQKLSVKGNLLSANEGSLTVDFGKGGYWEGRADDYGDAGYGSEADQHQNFYNPAFSNEIIAGGEVNVKMDEGFWNVTAQSWLTSLEANNTVIDMVVYENGGTNAVTIGELNGSGNTFRMALNNTDRLQSDMLYIKDGKADINVEVAGTIEGLENVSRENGLRFATVGSGIKLSGITLTEGGQAVIRGTDGGFMNTKLYVKRQDYAAGNAYNDDFNGGANMSFEKPGTSALEDFFDIKEKAAADTVDTDNVDNLVIVKAEAAGESDTGATILNLGKVNYSNAVYMDRLNKRLGEARYIDGDEGVWVRLRHDRIGKSDAFRSMNTMYEIGYDKKQNSDGGERRLGMAFDYMRGSSEFTGVNGSGEIKRTGLWLYDTWLGEKGHYADYVAKWGHLSNDFAFMTDSVGESTGAYSNNVFSLSAEYGRKKELGNNWYIEPQAQVQFAHVTGGAYTTVVGGKEQTDVRAEAFNSLIARAGFRLGKAYGTEKHANIYLKADAMYEFLGEQDIYVCDSTYNGYAGYDNGGIWYDIGVGIAAQMNKNSYWYLDLEKSFGNDYADTYQINAGMQLSF